MGRGGDYRRHKENSHLWRRLKEDRNQHYDDLSCTCWTNKKAIARFKEQPQTCSCPSCGNQRHVMGMTVAEHKNLDDFRQQIAEWRDDRIPIF
jgi:hypothetical protein